MNLGIVSDVMYNGHEIISGATSLIMGPIQKITVGHGLTDWAYLQWSPYIQPPSPAPTPLMCPQSPGRDNRDRNWAYTHIFCDT